MMHKKNKVVLAHPRLLNEFLLIEREMHRATTEGIYKEIPKPETKKAKVCATLKIV